MAPKVKESVKPRKGSGLQRKYGGIMGRRIKTRGGYAVVMRSGGLSKGKAPITYEIGQVKTYGTKELPGQFKTNMPDNCIRYNRPTHPITESGAWQTTIKENR